VRRRAPADAMPQGNKRADQQAACDACQEAPTPGPEQKGLRLNGPPGSKAAYYSKLAEAGWVLTRLALAGTKAGQEPGLPAPAGQLRRWVVSSASKRSIVQAWSTRRDNGTIQPGLA